MKTSALILALVAATVASATDITTQKVFGHWSLTPTSYKLGSGGPGYQPTASSSTWIAIGAADASEQAPAEGAVQIFNAVTGDWVRKLVPPLPATPNAAFGAACAISGNYLVVGAPRVAPGGAAYVYDLPTGKLLRTLKASDGVASDKLGVAIAISGHKVIIGADGDDGQQGSAYVFDITTGAQLAKLVASDGSSGHYFGDAIAAEGNLVLIGATGVDAERGAGYLFDLTTFVQLAKIQPAGSAAGDNCGWSVELHQGNAILGAPYASSNRGKVFIRRLSDSTETVLTASNAAPNDYLGAHLSASGGMILGSVTGVASGRGSVHAFDLNAGTSTELFTLVPQDTQAAIVFGYSISLSGSTAVITASFDDTQASDAGAAYIFRNLTKAMPLSKVTAKGDFAPGAVDIAFSTIGDVGMNADGELAFTSTLTGAGSGGNKDTGAWTTLAAGNPLDLVIKSRIADGGSIIGVVSQALSNTPTFGVIRSTITGTGVTTANNQMIYIDTGAVATQRLRTGNVVTEFPDLDDPGTGAMPSAFLAMVQSRQGTMGIPCSLKLGYHSTTALNDSALMLTTPASIQTERENETIAGTAAKYGQFAPRVAMFEDTATYCTAVQGAVTENQAIFARKLGNTEVMIARKGIQSVARHGGGGSLPDVVFSSFIGETNDDTDTTIYRATLSGSGTNASTNEGIWRSASNGAQALIFRKGQDLGVNIPSGFNGVPALAGVKIAKFLGYWQSYNQTLALVQLTGTGVTSANDVALLLFQTFGVSDQLIVLMREGEAAAGCPGATIGTISRVEVETYFGHYLVLATLAGAPSTSNLALFRGFSHLNITADTQTLRRPSLVLRKGQMFNNQPSAVKSFSLPATNITAGGAGGTGLARAMRETTNTQTPKEIVLQVEFNNGVKQVMKGTP